jgi:hypothetical protein
MSATGFTPIQLFRTATPGAAPTAISLADGELAINTADEKLFFKNAGGSVVEFSSGGIQFTDVKTANYTTAAGEGVQTSTTGGAFTVTLPATPATGDQVIITDAGGAWGTNNLTVGRNGSTIEGSATNLICDVSNLAVQLVFSGTTWTVFA